MESKTEILKKIGNTLSSPLFQVSGNELSLGSILIGLLVVWATFRLAKLSQRVIRQSLQGRDLDDGIKKTVERVCRYVVIVVGMVLALDTMGIGLGSLAVVGSVFVVGIGLGLQNITQNFFSYVVLLFERPIKVGDFITVGTTSGKVVDIGARSTLIHTRDGVDMLVPNSQFITSTVVNHSFSAPAIRYQVKVGVAYGSDMKLVKQILSEVAKSHKLVLNSPEPVVLMDEFGDSSVNFILQIWSNNHWASEVTLSDLRFKIDERFRHEGVTIPFPQRDVHLYQTPSRTEV